MKLTTEEIHNIYLHQGGIAEGLLRAGADADFPVMFAEAIIQFYEGKRKALTADEKSKLIGTLKWAEDLLRLSCNDEAVNDVQDCLMILKKAQEK